MAQTWQFTQQSTTTGSSLPPVTLLKFSGYHQSRHQQTLYLKDDAILFVVEGQINCKYGDRPHSLSRQGFVFFKKGTLLEYESVTPQCALLLFVIRHELSLQFAAMALRKPDTATSNEPVFWGEANKPLVDFYHTVGARLQEEGSIPEPLISIRILELMFQVSHSHPVIGNMIMDCRERYIRDIPAIVEEKLMDDVPVPQLARLAGRSLSSFRRDFFTIYNMAPSKWIRQKKLEKAQLLLVNTNMTITEICYTMGFQSNAHFSRAFKSCFGYPPSDRRKPVLSS